MANKPDSPVSGSGLTSYEDLIAQANYYLNPNQYMTGPGRSKWERIGNPMFTPAFEMAMFFTPMNPIIYRGLRLIKHSYDISEGVHDPNN